jgi:hypothetical protein
LTAAGDEVPVPGSTATGDVDDPVPGSTATGELDVPGRLDGVDCTGAELWVEAGWTGALVAVVGSKVAVVVGATVGAVGVGPVEATLEVVSRAGLVVSSIEVVLDEDENAPKPWAAEIT